MNVVHCEMDNEVRVEVTVAESEAGSDAEPKREAASGSTSGSTNGSKKGKSWLKRNSSDKSSRRPPGMIGLAPKRLHSNIACGLYIYTFSVTPDRPLKSKGVPTGHYSNQWGDDMTLF